MLLVLSSINMRAASVCSWTLASPILEKLVNTIMQNSNRRRVSLFLLRRRRRTISRTIDRKRRLEWKPANKQTYIHTYILYHLSFFIFHRTRSRRRHAAVDKLSFLSSRSTPLTVKCDQQYSLYLSIQSLIAFLSLSSLVTDADKRRKVVLVLFFSFSPTIINS